MPIHSRLANLANRKLITNALFTAKHGATPIKATCSHGSIIYGTSMRCETALDPETLEYALETAEKLWLCLPAGQGFESTFISTWPELTSRLNYIASCVLCDKHRTQDTITELVKDYTTALQAAALKEVDLAEHLYQVTTRAHVAPLWENVAEKKQARHNAENDPAAARGREEHARAERDAEKRKRAARDSADAGLNDQQHEKKKPRSSKSQRKHDKKQYQNFRPSPQYAPSCISEPDGTWLHMTSEYRKVWADYQYDNKKADALSKNKVPLLIRLLYPVFSGLPGDVNDTAVKMFYTKAIYHWGGDIIETMKAERTKWHPDKIDQRYNGEPDIEQVKEKANIIFRVANEIITETKEKIDRGFGRYPGQPWADGPAGGYHGWWCEGL